MRRASPVLIALRGVDAIKVYLPFMLLQGGIAERLPEWLRLPWLILVVYYSLTRLQVLFFDWLTTRFAIGDAGVTQQTGWPTRQLVHARWSEVGGLHIDQDLSHRLLGRHRARVVVGADGRDEILLEALDAATVAELRQRHAVASAAVVSASTPATSSAQTVSDTPELVHRTSWRDKLLISFTHGQFLLIVPFILGAYSDIAEITGLPSSTDVFDQVAAGSPTVIGLAVLAAFGFGIIQAALRYHRYAVVRSGETFTASGGLLHRHVRDARIADVRGVRISRNPLMRLVGCGSLSLVLATTRGEFRSLVVLPVAPLARVQLLAAEVLPGLTVERAASVRTPPRTLGALLALPAAGALGAWWLGLYWLAALLGCLTLLAANALWARVEVPLQGDVLTHRRGLIQLRSYAVRLSAIRSLDSWLLPGVCLSRTVVMDRRPTSLWALTPTSTVDSVIGRIMSAEQGACR